MPKTLTADPTNFPNVTVPTSGESRTASSVETPFQNLTDRTASLKQRLDLIDPTVEGVRKLRSFASIATLRAATDLGGICHVDGVGLFYYAAGSTATAQEPFVIQPTSVGGGAGRWLWEAHGSLNVANGIPQLDSSGLVPMASLPSELSTNRIIQTQLKTYAGPYTTTSASYVYVQSGPVTVVVDFQNVQEGDRLVVFGQAVQQQTDGAAATHTTRWTYNDGGVDTEIASSVVERTPAANSQPVGLPVGFHHIAGNSSEHVFTLWHKITGGVTAQIKNVMLVGLHIRP